MAGVYYCAANGCEIPEDVLIGITLGIFGFIIVSAIIGTLIDRKKGR